MAGRGPATPPTLRRGPTALGLLKMRWDYPVYAPAEAPATGPTVAQSARHALTREEALRVIAGDDPRPLLVLRECEVCNGTDDALLKGADNEQTYLLAMWFHCVKLPVDVLEPDHPFHNLFVLEDPEHLFVCSADGTGHDPLESQTSRPDLWRSMRTALARDYKQTPEAALRRVARIMDKMDQADQRWNELAARRDDLLEQEGPDSKALPKVAKELAQVEEERQALRADMVKESALELKPRPVPAGAQPGGPGCTTRGPAGPVPGPTGG